MNPCLIPRLLLLPCLLFFNNSFTQYILNGSATKNSCNCYTLTTATTYQSGSVWNSNKINLTNSFDFWFNVYLGCGDSGADGIVFILQPISTSVGSTGEGMGFGGVSPSIGIALDTYQNFNLSDPSYDHISIQANGNLNHTADLAGPVAISASATNVEDCQWHRLRISWDATTKWIRAWFDGVLRVEKSVDLVTTIFNNDPLVYWGFTGATGGQVNLQQFCTALDPIIKNNLNRDTVCVGEPVQFISQSESFAPIVNYNWTFGDGGSSSVQIPPVHVFSAPGIYNVTLKIKGLDGCENDTIKKLTVGSIPNADIKIFDTCYSNRPRLVYDTSMTGGAYTFNLNGSIMNTPWEDIPVGVHELQLIASSVFNCGPADTAIATFEIKPVPVIEISNTQLCKTISFTSNQLDNKTLIAQWNWDFGDNFHSTVQNPQHNYAEGNYTATAWATADNGCSSDTSQLIIDIEGAHVFAGNDTTVIINQPFQLNGSGNGVLSWTPLTGLSDPLSSNPAVTLSNDREFTLTVTTAQGCTASDKIKIRVFEGPTVYVPSAFTPNGDGRNDLLRPVYVGIVSISRFTVYNRWGQLVYTTKSMQQGWDGKINQQLQATGTYVWVVEGMNYLKQPVLFKGMVTLIK